jgi:hypothetical protein
MGEDKTGFDISKFDRATFQPREDEMKLDGLKDFFKGEPIIKVRGLTINEFSKCKDINSNTKLIQSLSEALFANSGKDIKDNVEKLIGFGDDVAPDVKYRIQLTLFGLIEPKLERGQIVKLGEAFPTEFFMISNKIVELTGQGQEVMGKPLPSGKAAESKTA